MERHRLGRWRSPGSLTMLIETLDDTAARLDIRVTKGRTWVMPIEFAKDDGTATDITGLTITFDLYESGDETVPVLSATVAVVDAVSGVAEASLTAADLADLEGTYWYVCDVTDGVSIAAVFGGVFYVDKGVPG